MSDRNVIATANALGARLAVLWEQNPGVREVSLAMVLDDIVHGQVVIDEEAQRVETAEALATAARTALVSASLEFYLILDDGDNAHEYRWSNVTDTWIITPLTMVTRQPTPDDTSEGSE